MVILLEDETEVDDLLESNGYLEVTFVFVQAKTSSNFNTAEMHQFYFGIQDFFSEEPQLPRNEDVVRASELADYILSFASEFKENPICKNYYVTTGTYNSDDQNIEARLTEFSNFENLNLFSKIESHVLGANEIGKLYRKTKNSTTAKFVVSK